MVDKSSQVDYVAIYAAVISTITLVWNIINSIIDKTSRLDVKASFHDSFISIGNKNIDGPRSMKVSIVNKSNRVKYVKSINIKLPYKTSFGKYCNLYKMGQNSAIAIKPEEEYVEEYKLNHSAMWMFEGYAEGKFRIIVHDTTGKNTKQKN